MIDLGFIQIPTEILAVIAIVTALCLAALYIGFDIIAAIGGMVAVVFGLRIALYEYEAVVNGYPLGTTEGWLLVIVGAFLVVRGTGSFFDPDNGRSF